MTRNELERRDKIIMNYKIYPSDYDRLVTLSEQLRQCAVRECNGYYSNQQQRWNETRAENILTEAKSIIDKYNQIMFYQPDPRSCALYMLDKKSAEEKYNDYVKRHNKISDKPADSFKYWLTYSYTSIQNVAFYVDK